MVRRRATVADSRMAIAALTACFLAVAVAPGCVFAQRLSPKQPLQPGWEQWLDEVPVSGGVRVGVMGGADLSPVEPEHFVVFLPPSRYTSVCVEISSKDGRYEARLEYDVSDRPDGPVEFELPTSHGAQLAGYAARDLSILAYAAAGCENEPASYFVSSWRPLTTLDTVSVFVNSDDPTVLVGGRSGTIEFEYTCLPIDGAVAAKAYNRECRIPASVITPETGFTLRRRVRIRNRIQIRPYDLPLQR